MKKVFFLVNNLEDFKSYKYLKKYLSDIDVTINTSFPTKPDDYTLIVLWNYRKIIKNISNSKNVIIFHGSDLPEGKGWAPIYYSLTNAKEYYTISGILPVDKVDSGDIVIQAKFKIKDNYTAEIIREFDNEISIILTKKIIERFENGKLKGKRQEGKESFYSRRKPEDNEIDSNSRISDVFNHLKACEKSHSAFFYYHQTRFNVSITPDPKPSFPKDLEIKFFDSKN